MHRVWNRAENRVFREIVSFFSYSASFILLSTYFASYSVLILLYITIFFVMIVFPIHFEMLKTILYGISDRKMGINHARKVHNHNA